ncbi:hypothetical protein ABGB07_20610 [Micromonosporaceae bacterium B7E4]
MSTVGWLADRMLSAFAPRAARAGAEQCWTEPAPCQPCATFKTKECWELWCNGEYRGTDCASCDTC